jgi:hypothetical protein
MTSILQLNTYCHSPYVTSCLTRGCVCHLQLMLALASTVILRSECHRTHDHILLSQIRDSSNLEDQVPIFIYPRNRMAQLYPPALGSLLSPPMTRKATVKVFDYASTQASDSSCLRSLLCSIGVNPQKTQFILVYCFRRPPTGCLPRICCPSNSDVTLLRIRGNAFTEPLPSNERLLWLHYSGVMSQYIYIYIYLSHCYNVSFRVSCHVW